METKLKLFNEKQIRASWNADEEEWYFSVVDVVAVLTDSADPPAYWRKLKQRLKEEGNETVTKCHALKMPLSGWGTIYTLTERKNFIKENLCRRKSSFYYTKPSKKT